MEEEKIETTQTQGTNQANKFDFKSFDYKKYLPFAGIALAVIVVLIILVSVLGGGPKKAVKKYVSGMNGRNAKKVLKNIDIAGMAVWEFSYYDEDDFDEEDYEEFVEAYEEAEENLKELEDEYKEQIDDLEDSIEDEFDDIDDEYKSFKVRIEKFKEVKKIGKDLYVVEVKIAREGKPKDKEETDEVDESELETFIVYKNKLISFGDLWF